MKELPQRILTGVIFLVIVIGAIMINPITLATIFYIIAILGLLEYYSLCKVGGVHPQGTLGVITSTALYISIELVKLEAIPVVGVAISIPLFLAIFIYELFRKRPDPFTNIAHTILGIIYIVAPLALLNVFSFEQLVYVDNRDVVLGFFILLWLNDTGAYVFGKLLGKHKIFPRISPKKTWEGTIGGALASITGGIVIATQFSHVGLYHWIALSLIIVVFGSLGDMVESLLKRSLQVKDSSNILPGHGGILDRFDGVLIASPMVFTYLTVFVH